MAENNSDFYKRNTLPPVKPDPVLENQPLPTQIGPYTIDKLIEKGGMSYLFLSHDPATKQPIIIKVLSPKFVKNKEASDRFLNEAKIIKMANHPNIVTLFDSGVWENGLYIAMEYIEGISLRKWLENTPAGLKKRIEMILEIAYALVHLHTHHVIHRDLKPENILVAQSGHIKVIDFGIAQVLNEKGQDSQNKRFIGTPIYISPEQREDPEKVSYPSDIYSLGIIAYEILLGKLSQGQVHLALMPKGVRGILAKALNPNPSERYHDVVDFIGDLSLYLHSAELEKDKKQNENFSSLYRDILDEAQNVLNKPIEGMEFRLSLTPYPTILWGKFKDVFVLLEDTERNERTFLKYFEIYGFLKSLHFDNIANLIKMLQSFLANYSSVFVGAILSIKDNEVRGVSFGDVKIIIDDKQMKSEIPLGMNLETPSLFTSEKKTRVIIHTLKEFSLEKSDPISLITETKLKDPEFAKDRQPYIFIFK